MRASQRQKPSLGGTIGSLVDTHYRDRATLQRIRELGRMVASTTALIHELQRERGLSSGALAGGGRRFEADNKDQVARTDEALRLASELWASLASGPRSGALEAAVGAAGSHLVDLPRVRADVAALSLTSASAVQRYSALIDRLLVIVGEAPGTSPHPQVTLALIALFNFVLAKEYAGQERALGSAVCAQGHFEPFQYERFLMLGRQRDEAHEVFVRHATRVQRGEWEGLRLGPGFADLEGLRSALVALKAGTGRTPDAELWFDKATAVIDVLKGFESGLLTDLDHLCLQVLAEVRSAWEDSQESPEDLEKLVLHRLEKHHLRIQTERQEQRMATRADRAADVVSGSANVIEEASRWRRDLDALEGLATSLTTLSRQAKILSLDASIEAVSAAEVVAGARQLSRAVQDVADELENRLENLRAGADRAVGAFEGFHTAILTLRKDLLEGNRP